MWETTVRTSSHQFAPFLSQNMVHHAPHIANLPNKDLKDSISSHDNHTLFAVSTKMCGFCFWFASAFRILEKSSTSPFYTIYYCMHRAFLFWIVHFSHHNNSIDLRLSFHLRNHPIPTETHSTMMTIKDENTHNSGAADDDALAAIADAVDETSSIGHTRRVAKTVSFVIITLSMFNNSVCVFV